MAALSSLGLGVLIAGATIFLVVLVVFILWLLHINGRLCPKNKFPHRNLPPASNDVHMAGFQPPQDDPRSSSSSSMSVRVLSALGVHQDKYRGRNKARNNHNDNGDLNSKEHTQKQLDNSFSSFQTFKTHVTSPISVIPSAPSPDDEDGVNVYDEADEVKRIQTNRYVVHKNVKTSNIDKDSNTYMEVIRDSVLQEGDLNCNSDITQNQHTTFDNSSKSHDVYVELENISDDEKDADDFADDKFEYSLASNVQSPHNKEESGSASDVRTPKTKIEHLEKSGIDTEVVQIDQQDYFILEQTEKPVETDVDNYEIANEVTAGKDDSLSVKVTDDLQQQSYNFPEKESRNGDNLKNGQCDGAEVDISSLNPNQNILNNEQGMVGGDMSESSVDTFKNDLPHINSDYVSVQDVSNGLNMRMCNTSLLSRSHTDCVSKDDPLLSVTNTCQNNFLKPKDDKVATDKQYDVIKIRDDDVGTTFSDDISPTMSDDNGADDDVMFAYNVGV